MTGATEDLRGVRTTGRAGSTRQRLERSPSLGDVGEPRALFANTGFERVEVTPRSMRARFPDPDAFLAGEIEADTASIRSMQQTEPDTRRQIVDAVASEMQEPLSGTTDNDHVVIDFHAHCLRARAGRHSSL